MISYLVSSPGGQYKVDGKRLPTSLNNDNGFEKDDLLELTLYK